MKQFITIILISIFIISCTSNTIYKKPEDLISKDLMVDLLVDMQLALSAKSVRNKNGENKLEYMHLVYNKYGVDSTLFSTSNFYYTTDIDQYSDILKRVKEKLEKMKKIYELEKMKVDSLGKSPKPFLNDSISPERVLTNKSKMSKIDTSFVK